MKRSGMKNLKSCNLGLSFASPRIHEYRKFQIFKFSNWDGGGKEVYETGGRGDEETEINSCIRGFFCDGVTEGRGDKRKRRRGDEGTRRQK